MEIIKLLYDMNQSLDNKDLIIILLILDVKIRQLSAAAVELLKWAVPRRYLGRLFARHLCQDGCIPSVISFLSVILMSSMINQ